MQDAVGSLGLGFVAPWVLSDFTPGSLTWEPANSPQYGFGLFRAKGQASAGINQIALAFFSSSTTVSGAGWNTIPITPAALMANTTYWLAYNSSGSNDNLAFSGNGVG